MEPIKFSMNTGKVCSHMPSKEIGKTVDVLLFLIERYTLQSRFFFFPEDCKTTSPLRNQVRSVMQRILFDWYPGFEYQIQKMFTADRKYFSYQYFFETHLHNTDTKNNESMFEMYSKLSIDLGKICPKSIFADELSTENNVLKSVHEIGAKYSLVKELIPRVLEEKLLVPMHVIRSLDRTTPIPQIKNIVAHELSLFPHLERDNYISIAKFVNFKNHCGVVQAKDNHELYYEQNFHPYIKMHNIFCNGIYEIYNKVVNA